MLELNRGGRAGVQTEIVEFIALPFPSSKNLKNLVISRRSCAGKAKKCTNYLSWDSVAERLER